MATAHGMRRMGGASFELELRRNRALAASYRRAQEVTRHHAKSFYFSSFPLPWEKRAAAYAVYAFCRHADDTMDEQPEPERAKGQLSGLLNDLYAGGSGRGLPWAQAFQDAVRRFAIPREHFDELVHGVELDARSHVAVTSWVELRDYCYYVASVVGLVMACIFGMRRPSAREQAIELGLAMQLTNILRDVREDAERGRVYLPAEGLAEYGIDPGSLVGGRPKPDEAWLRFARDWVTRADGHYRAAEAGIGALDADGSQWTVWCMRWIYAEILREVERHGYDVSQRRAVGWGRKVWLVGRAWRSYRRSLGDSR